MAIIRRKFVDRFLILPNSKYVFSSEAEYESHPRIVYTFECEKTAQILISSSGALGFIFHNEGPLASIDILKFQESGRVPENVVKNEDDINMLQEKRLVFANFIAAALFGRIFAKLHRALDGAVYSGQDKIVGFDVRDNLVYFEQTEYFTSVQDKKHKQLQNNKNRSYFIDRSCLDDAVSFVQHLWNRAKEFEYADLPQCMVMNYQAAILHNQQHAGASLAINFSVIESLIREIFYAYGFIQGFRAKPFAIKEYEIEKISRNDFKDMKFYGLMKILHDAKLLDQYLYDRLEDKRVKRNNLMHKGDVIISKDSGDTQTLVRDLWAFLIDVPFELNAIWSYRR